MSQLIIGHRDFIVQLWMGAYPLIALIFWYKAAKYQQRLKVYVQRISPQFYNEHLFAPLISIGVGGSKRSYTVFKYLFWGEMPDETSKNYQHEANFFTILFLLWAVIGFLILIPIFYV